MIYLYSDSLRCQLRSIYPATTLFMQISIYLHHIAVKYFAERH